MQKRNQVYWRSRKNERGLLKMTKIIVDLPEDLDEKVAIYKIKNKLITKADALIELLDNKIIK